MASAALQAAIDRYEASVKRLAAANQALAESQAPLVRQFKPGIADQPAASTGVNPLLMNWPRMRSPTLAEKFEFQDQDRFAKDNQAQGEGYIDHADKVYWEGLQAWDDPTEFARIGAMPDTSPERPTISAPPGARYETGEQQIISGAGPVSLSRPVTKPVERSQANVITRTEAPGAFSRAVGIAKNTGDPIEAVKELTEELSAPVRRRIIETEAGAVHGATAGLLPGFSKEDISKLKQFNWGKIEPSFMYDVGEFGGAVAPIMGISKVIAPISRLTGLGALETGTVLRSMNPVLRRQIPKLIEEGTLGVIYEGLRAKGDLSAIEALEHALYWAGIGQLGRVVGGVVKLLRGKPLTPKIPLEGEIKPAETPVAGAVPEAVLPEKPLPAAAPATEAGPQIPRPTPEPPVAKTGAKEPWEMGKEDFEKQNPHSGGALTGNPDAFNALPDNADIWVFHATSKENASILLGGKGIPALQGKGIKGKSSGIYVGGNPNAVSGYGDTILALKVKKSQVSIPAEGSRKPSVGHAITDASVGAIVEGKPIEVIRVPTGSTSAYESIKNGLEYPKRNVPYNELWKTPKSVAIGNPHKLIPVSEQRFNPVEYELGKAYQRLSNEHRLAVQDALDAGKPVPPEVLADYPDLKPKGATDAVQGKAVPKTGAKEPWEMTQAETIQEFRNRNWTKLDGGYYRYGEGAHGERQWIKISDKEIESLDRSSVGGHEITVGQALSEGKPVPPEVLAEYPDLKPKGVPDAVQGVKPPVAKAGLLRPKAVEPPVAQPKTEHVGPTLVLSPKQLLSAKSKIRKHYGLNRQVTDAEVYEEITNLKRKELKGNLDDWQGRLLATLEVGDHPIPAMIVTKPKGVPDAVQGKEIPKVGQAAKIGQAGQIQEVTPGQTPIVSRETLPRETPETPAGPGLTKAENAAMRRELNLDALPPAQREKFTEWEQAAKDARMDDDALNIAEDIIVKKRAHTPEEFAALSLKKTKVRSEHDLSLSIVEELKARGEMNAAALESAKADVLQGQLDQISRAAEIGGQETARAQVSRKIGFEADDEWSLTTVMTKAAEKKGRPLTTDDKQLIEQVSAAERRAYEKIMKERTKYELERDARLKTEAELVKAREEKTLTREQSRLGRVGSARAERADALKELERMGFAVHELTGVTLESSYQIGRVAASFFREGAANLDDAVRKTIERIPGLTDRQVWEALAAKSPKRIAAVRKEGTVALQQARSLAKARVNLENANNGIFAETAPRPPRTGEIVDLQHQLTRMRARAYRSGMTPGKLEKTQQKISELYDLLENHRSVLKKNGKIDATALSETRARIKDLEPTMGLDELLGRLNKQIETGIPHIPSIKPPPELPEYLLRAEVELRQARNQVRTTVNDLEPWTSRRYFQETMSALRTVKATLDASAILRQGLILSARRPGVALDAAGKGFHSVVSKHTAEQAMHAIESAPHHYKRILSDLYLSPLEGGSLVGREEMIGSNLFTKIPWLKKTYGRFAVEPFSRQMIVDLDLLRVGAFDQFLRAYPNATMQELKAWANWINVATGRGNLSQGAADWLSTTFFAPRFAMSRIQAPWMLFKYWKLPRVRNEIAKDMGATAGLLASGLGLAALGGATIGTDSREADFLKARFGDTRVDLFAGMQQPLRALMRIFTIATDEAGLTGNDLADNMKDIEPLEIMYRFLSYKTAPAIEQANWLLTGGFKGTGKNIMGEEEDIPVHLVKTLMPIVYQDIFDAIINDRVNSAVLGGTVADFFGAGANTYEDNESYYRREIMRAQEAGDFERAETLKAQWNIGHPDKQIVNVGMLGESTWPEIYKRLKDEGAGQDDIDHAREEWKAATKRRMEVKAKFMKERLKK